MHTEKKGLTEDQTALLLGAFIFVIAMLNFAGMNWLGWIVKAGTWLNPIAMFGATNSAVGKTIGEWLSPAAAGWFCLLLTYGAITALLAVGAYDLKDRNYTEISDGQLQRIMLARAICQEPEIILLDEPTSFLDIRYAVDILDILRDMAKKRGVTVVLSLHELNYAKRVSDLVMCVKSGRVVCVGDPAEIFTKDIVSGLYDLPEGYYEQLFGGL
jgi:hypothetical protein